MISRREILAVVRDLLAAASTLTASTPHEMQSVGGCLSPPGLESDHQHWDNRVIIHPACNPIVRAARDGEDTHSRTLEHFIYLHTVSQRWH